jgi:hypothetical protein
MVLLLRRRRGHVNIAGRTPAFINSHLYCRVIILLLDPPVDLDDPPVLGLLPVGVGLPVGLLPRPEPLLGSVLVSRVLLKVEQPQPLSLLYVGNPLLFTQLLPPLTQVLNMVMILYS